MIIAARPARSQAIKRKWRSVSIRKGLALRIFRIFPPIEGTPTPREEPVFEPDLIWAAGRAVGRRGFVSGSWNSENLSGMSIS